MSPRVPAAALLSASLLLSAACSRPDPASASLHKGAAAAPPDAVEVQTFVVVAQPLQRELVAVGSLRSDESVTVASEIAGRITRVGFDEGQPVKRGALLFELDDAVYRAEVEQARANLALSQRSAARADELFAQKLIAAQDRDQTAATLQVNRAALQLAEARLDKTRITAPFDGVAGLRLVSPGTYVQAGQALATVEALARMKLDFRLPELALPALAVGQPLQLEVDALPGQAFTGEVYAIDPRVADDSRSIGVRARVSNEQGRLRPGLFARVRLVVERKTDALVIPEQAIQPRGDQLFAFVVQDGQARMRAIRLGQREPGKAEVIEGLRAGEAVVISGLQRLADGVAVRSTAAD
jgi:membrane fusion protein (multidrug efflux system)